MQQKIYDTVVIGAGLTGLTIGHLLRDREDDFLILEARNRIGGRILTATAEGEAPVEMGATWFGRKHTALVQLLKELDLAAFEQYNGTHAVFTPGPGQPTQRILLPPNDEPSYRISGGSRQLIQKLAGSIPEARLRLGTAVHSVRFTDENVIINVDHEEIHARRLISTLPPNLLVSTISFEPGLPPSLTQLARRTHTWMGSSIKVALRYDRPFWRSPESPGATLFSNAGPVTECYDHTTVEGDRHAIKGFMREELARLSPGERKQRFLDQLRPVYGSEVDGYTAYEEAVWSDDRWTYLPNEGPVAPHQHNGHPLFRDPFFGGKLILAGTETAVAFPGYMDGAVRSAYRVIPT